MSPTSKEAGDVRESRRGIIVLAAAVIITLGGATLGGVAGMRFHRKVDMAGHSSQ
jgi:hypothetical protein